MTAGYSVAAVLEVPVCVSYISPSLKLTDIQALSIKVEDFVPPTFFCSLATPLHQKFFKELGSHSCRVCNVPTLVVG